MSQLSSDAYSGNRIGIYPKAGNVPPLQDYFGTLNPERAKMLAEDAFAHETYNLPKAYEGRNKYLENVLDYLITNESDWYTSLALPWEATDQLSVQWEIFRFNKTLFDLEPEQGVPRYVSAERESRTDRLVRRGLGFIIEHGFYETEEGRSHYLMNLRQISDSVHETCYFGVMRALLTAHDYYKAHRAEHGPVRTKFAELTRVERNRWAIIQKDELGLYTLDAEIKHAFRRQGLEHNLIVLPDTTSMYVTMVPNFQREYSRHGPGNMANLEKGEDNLLTFRGSRVVESKPFDIDFLGEGTDLLLRERMIGEYFVLEAGEDGMYIYSADADDFHYLSRADIEGNVRGVGGAGGAGAAPAAARIIVFRPFQRYLMGSGLFLRGGSELGATYHGHHNFMLSDDAIRKVHVGHYTFYSKSLIKNDKLLTIAEDIIARDYLGGEGHEFIDDDDINAIKAGNWDLVKGSLIAFQTNQDGTPISNPLSIRDEDGLNGEPYAARYEKPDGRVDGLRVLEALGLQNAVPQPNDQTRDRFLTDMRSINTVCYRGMQLDAAKRITHLNTGHWGPNVYPGVLAVRRGEMSFIQDMKYRERMINVGPAGGRDTAAGVDALNLNRSSVQAVPNAQVPAAAVPQGISSSAASRRSKKKSSSSEPQV